MPAMDRIEQDLESLLRSAFEVAELRRLARAIDEELAESLPSEPIDARTFSQKLVSALARRHLIDARLFALLRAERPNRQDIAELAEAWERRPEPVTDGSADTTPSRDGRVARPAAGGGMTNEQARTWLVKVSLAINLFLIVFAAAAPEVCRVELSA